MKLLCIYMKERDVCIEVQDYVRNRTLCIQNYMDGNDN